LAAEDDLAFVGQLLDTYAQHAWRKDVAAEAADDRGVPQPMQVGEVDEEGWVEWRVLPSTLKYVDVEAIETEFGIEFPPIFRAYLISRFHLFHEVTSRRHDQQLFIPATPAVNPLGQLKALMNAWRPLIDAEYIPIADWGDGWGPICFDSANRAPDGDCPIVWMDHELLIPLGKEKCRQREQISLLAQPLYESSRELLVDVFGRN